MAIKVWRGLSLAWLLGLSAAYFWPGDALYAITIWPPFVWAGPAFLGALVGIRKSRTRAQLLLLAAWLFFWIGFGEERKWVGHTLYEPYSSEALRVVSLNCAGGTIEAAEEAFTHNPRILLLQESPGRKELEALVAKEFGEDSSLLAGPDASIAVQGKLEPIELPKGTSNFVAAIAKLPDLEPILVVSLRLQPPVFRLDYWNPDCWRAYAENRRQRRQELKDIGAFLGEHRSKVKWAIIGGDFNNPPDKGVYRPLSSWLKPATQDSGYTAVNEFPLARIDQIWSNVPSFFSIARKTQHSDHRVVVWQFFPEPMR